MENQPLPGALGTRINDYPGIAAEKYHVAIERVANVHRRFQKELDVIQREIGTQGALSTIALERCLEVSPFIETITRNTGEIGDIARQAGKHVQDGRLGLQDSVTEVRSAIGQLRARNLEMQKIRDISRHVTESINKIAEIALENKVIAINASVTASKASDKVKGFKVIANEITKLSAGMSERVGMIVELSTQVSARMEQIISYMEESIQSTQKAMGTIDDAFGLLNQIEETITDTAKANATLLAENHMLAKKMRSLNEAMSVIENNIISTGYQTDEVQKSMREQAALIQGILRILPDLQAVCDSIATAETRAGDRTEKKLRCCESALDNYDPTHTRMLREMHYITFTCIRLLRYSSDKKLVPYLAETWFLLPDGRTWEFNLKEHVEFGDGTVISSNDVKFSLERLMNPALKSPYGNLFSVIEGYEDFVSGRTGSVRGIVPVDRVTIRITLKSSFNFFLSLLALSFSSIIKEDRTAFSRKLGKEELVSAGPFRYAESADPDVDLLVCNNKFINGRPFLDSMEIRRNQGNSAEAVATGSLDLAYGIPAASEDIFRKHGFKGELRYYASRYCYSLVVNFRKDNFLTRNAELRRALVMAINKDDIVANALGGKAVRADAVLPAETLDIGGRRFIDYDLEKAKNIILSYKNRENLDKPINLAFRGYLAIPNMEKIAAMIEKTFVQLGLKVNLSIHPANTPISAFTEEYDLVFLGFLSELDLYSALEPFINPDGGDNYFKYQNKEIFSALNDSLTIKDNKARTEAFIRILEQLTLDVFAMPLFFVKSILAIRKNVHSVFLSSEESFFPDATYLAADKNPAASLLDTTTHVEAATLARYGDIIRKLDTETGTIAITSEKLITTGQTISTLLEAQRESIRTSNDLFSSFAASAEAAQATRIGVAEKIRATSEEVGMSSRAADLIQSGLLDLATALETTFRSLDQVKKDIRKMLSIVDNINESNGLIASVAINAAIISAKTDVRGGDLVKVSQAISEQAKRNTDNTNTTKQILEEMGHTVADHFDFLNIMVRGINIADRRVGQSGDVLKKVVPLLANINKKSQATEETSAELATLVADARGSVGQINEKVSALAQNAETLRFGLDMEQAVADVLKDIAWINTDIARFLAQADY